MAGSLFFALVLLARVDFAALFSLHAALRPHSCTRACTTVRMMAKGEEWEDGGEYMEELRRRISTSASAAHLGPPEEVLRHIKKVYVLIFNPGRNDEGVYTLQGRTTPASSYVLAFEQTDEAERFAELLQAEGFDLPKPMEWQADQVRNFCETGQFELGIVPTGALLTPPMHNEWDEEAYGRLAAGEDAFMGSNPMIDEQRERLDRLFDL